MENFKVLVVEDDPLTPKYIKSMLEKMGCSEVKCTGSGEEAVTLAKTFSPHFIIMDIRLEGEMNGIDAARKIQEDADIPVLFISAYNYKEKIRESHIAHLVDFINKPVEEHQLRECIRMAQEAVAKKKGGNG